MYDATDLSLVLSTCDNLKYQEISKGLSHRAVMQYDKHSDELSLQRVSDPAINVCTDVGSVIKTDVPELRRPWFSESNDDIGKPLFVTVSKEGVVFFTDDYSKSVFFYRQNPMPRKLFRIVKAFDGDALLDPLSEEPTDIANAVWLCPTGLTLCKDEKYLVIADPNFHALRVIRSTSGGVNVLWRLPKTKLQINNVTIQNKEKISFFPCSVKESHDSILFCTDPVNIAIYVINLLDDCHQCFIESTISLEYITRPIDCLPWNNFEILITGTTPEGKGVVKCNYFDKKVIASNNEQFCRPFGLCNYDNSILVSDQENHCIFKLDEQLDQCEVFVGKRNLEGFVDGCAENSTLSSPAGICSRELTLFICENPATKQGSIRVLSLLNGLVSFRSIWKEFTRAVGMYSKRERVSLQMDQNDPLLKGQNVVNALESLQDPVRRLERLIIETRARFTQHQLDVTHGSRVLELLKLSVILSQMVFDF